MKLLKFWLATAATAALPAAAAQVPDSSSRAITGAVVDLGIDCPTLAFSQDIGIEGQAPPIAAIGIAAQQHPG